MKACCAGIFLSAGLSFGYPWNEIESIVKFEFIRYEIRINVTHSFGDSGKYNESSMTVKNSTEITNKSPTNLMNGIDSIKLDDWGKPLCGCDGCSTETTVTFFGLKNKKLIVDYGACGGNYEEARFTKGKAKYIVYFSNSQAKTLETIFDKLGADGIMEIQEHFSGRK